MRVWACAVFVTTNIYHITLPNSHFFLPTVTVSSNTENSYGVSPFDVTLIILQSEYGLIPSDLFSAEAETISEQLSDGSLSGILADLASNRLTVVNLLLKATTSRYVLHGAVGFYLVFYLLYLVSLLNG